MKISINLLPPEVRAEKLKQVKYYKIQTIGIIVILTLVFLTTLTLAMRILQSRNITEAQAKTEETGQRVSDLKTTQASLILLSDRLKVINQHFGVSSKQSEMYKLMDKLIPASVSINAITIGKAGDAVFLALVPDSTSLDNLINSLASKESNEGKISQVSIESLNRGRDSQYRVSFKIKP